MCIRDRATRYSEGLLAIKYRVENKDGNMSGGPMFVLERGLKDVYKRQL